MTLMPTSMSIMLISGFAVIDEHGFIDVNSVRGDPAQCSAYLYTHDLRLKGNFSVVPVTIYADTCAIAAAGADIEH